MNRKELIDLRNELMKPVIVEREENKKHGIKHLSRASRNILDRIWVIDDKIMQLT